MHIVKFQGALGNQMFEYAFYKRIAKEYPDNTIKAYIGVIKDFNGYELDRVFGINLDKTNWKQVIRLSNNYPEEAPLSKVLNKLCKIRQITGGYKVSHIKQDDNTAYYPEVFNLNPLYSYYFDGVWANSQYIEDLREDLIKDFQFIEPLEGQNLYIAQKMQMQNSICVHVRRNEYVTMGLTVTSDDYYKRAVEIIKTKIEKPVFYVFSDDHEYCKSLFNGMIDFVMVEGNSGNNSFKDMQLMSYCRHNIIANSTFSFWGAYLSEYSEKVVIAPNLSWGQMKHPFARDSWMILDAK